MIRNIFAWYTTVNRRTVVLLYIFFALLPVCSLAQQKLGVIWDIPASQARAVQELKQFKGIGISALEIKEQPSKEVWHQIERLHFSVYANLDIRFPVAKTFSKIDSSFIHDFRLQVEGLSSHSSVQFIGLFDYAPWYDPFFGKAVMPFTQSLKKFEKPLYYISRSFYDAAENQDIKTLYEAHITAANISKFSLPDKNSIIAYQFSVSGELRGAVYAFKKFLHALPQHDSKVAFIPHAWLKSTIKKHPAFASTLQKITQRPDQITFSESPPELPTTQPSTLPITVLLVVWVSIAVHYNTKPLYRKPLLRYFVNHTFFVNDILRHYLRISLSALTIIIQHALLISASTVSVFLAIFSPLGRKALRYHFPTFFFRQDPVLSLFIWVFTFALILSIINVIWLKIADKNTTSITQIAALYACPLQLNFIFGSAAVIGLASQANDMIIISADLLSLVTFFCSFIAASTDISSHLYTKKCRYWLTTTGCYLIITTGSVTWIATQTNWIDVIRLALHL